jgi:hypothetical protein
MDSKGIGMSARTRENKALLGLMIFEPIFTIPAMPDATTLLYA